ncbi:MAG: hypothetical protein IPK19_00465 [Chloroflexi bacterium]|nr:hypothetical protein [Chloroflexota bacterium]
MSATICAASDVVYPVESQLANRLLVGARDVLPADQGGFVAGFLEVGGQITLIRVQSPAKRIVRQPEHAVGMGIAPGIQRRPAGAALWGGAEAARKANTPLGEEIQVW